MFDKKKYRERRKKGLRGQQYPEPVFHPKGEKVFKTNKDGKKTKVEVPNDTGHNMKMGFGLVSRKEARRKPAKFIDTSAKDLRKEQKAAKHARRNAGEHERALKVKEKNREQ